MNIWRIYCFWDSVTPSITQWHSFLLRWYNPNVWASICHINTIDYIALLFYWCQCIWRSPSLTSMEWSWTGKNKFYWYAAYDCHGYAELCSMPSVLWCEIANVPLQKITVYTIYEIICNDLVFSEWKQYVNIIWIKYSKFAVLASRQLLLFIYEDSLPF